MIIYNHCWDYQNLGPTAAHPCIHPCLSHQGNPPMHSPVPETPRQPTHALTRAWHTKAAHPCIHPCLSHQGSQPMHSPMPESPRQPSPPMHSQMPGYQRQPTHTLTRAWVTMAAHPCTHPCLVRALGSSTAVRGDMWCTIHGGRVYRVTEEYELASWCSVIKLIIQNIYSRLLVFFDNAPLLK